MWNSKEARRHIDLNAPGEDLEHAFSALKSKQDVMEEDAAFVDTIDEDVPSLTPFNGKTLVTRLPYRIVTRIQPVPKRSGWMIDNKHVISMPVSVILKSSASAHLLNGWCNRQGGNFTRGFSNVYTPKA